MSDLKNADPEWDKPEGHQIGAIIYGGRDSDTSAPVREAYSWAHGVCTMGATLESETTAATQGAEGVRTWNVMSNMDFLSMSVGRYIENNLEFAKDIERPPVFGTNYFIRKDGKFLNGKLDKAIWIKWIELRAHNDVDALDAGYGRIPKFEDLQRLFKEVRGEDYSEQDYIDQFTVRIPELLAKHDRMDKIFATVEELPAAFNEEMTAQVERLKKLQAEKGDYISPFDL
jgi:phosphoenolpyruvate carboxykinase (GTP)